MPVDRGAIDAQLREIGEGERWWERREFRELPYVLQPDERIRGIVNGWLHGSRRPRVGRGGRWLVVATDQRLLCLRQERMARKQVDLPWPQVTRVRQLRRFRTFQLTLWTTMRRYRLRIASADAFRFSGAIAPLLPAQALETVDPGAEAFSWIPGMRAVAALPGVGGIVSRVAALSPPDAPATRAELERVEGTVERLQAEVERLQQQVAFLEGLLQKRAEAADLVRASPER